MLEQSKFQAIDHALGHFILEAYSHLEPSVTTKGMQDFLAREDQLYWGAGEDIKAFRKQMGAKAPGEVNLPLLTLHRKPGFSNDQASGFFKEVAAYNHELEHRFQISIAPIAFDYSLIFFSWDLPSLDELQLSLYLHFKSQPYFTIPYSIAGETIEVPARLRDEVNQVYSNISLPKAEGGMLGTQLGFSVTTQVLQGQSVTPMNLDIQIHELQLIFSDEASGTEPSEALTNPEPPPTGGNGNELPIDLGLLEPLPLDPSPGFIPTIPLFPMDDYDFGPFAPFTPIEIDELLAPPIIFEIE